MGRDCVWLVLRPLFGLLYQPQMIDDDDWSNRWNANWQGSRSTWRKPAPVPLCPPQILHDLTLARTRAAAVGSQLIRKLLDSVSIYFRFFICHSDIQTYMHRTSLPQGCHALVCRVDGLINYEENHYKFIKLHSETTIYAR
jgi:hypothetical protein